MGGRRVAALIAVMAIAGGAGGMFASGAGAGVMPFDSTAELIGITENTWRVSYDTTPCENGDPFVSSVTIEGTPVEPLSQSVENASSVLVTLPADAPAGLATFVLLCATGDSNTSTSADAYAWVAITKVVDGVVPADSTFTVNIDCSSVQPLAVAASGWGGDAGVEQDPGPFAVDLPYGAEGGVAYVYSDNFRDCSITEPNDGGATSTTIDVPDDLFFGAAQYEATVTNVFAAAVPDPVVVTPTFTG